MMNRVYKVLTIVLLILFIASCARKVKSSDFSGKIIWHGNKNLPYIALTFDDGPNSTSTPQILDILKRYNVKATFFVLGKYAELNRDILKREAEEGHEIGNHTWSHANGYVVDFRKITQELEKTSNLVEEITGKKIYLFRPPFGFENWRFLKIAENLGYTTVLWTVDAGGWNKFKIKDIVENVIKHTEGGSIVLLHDGGKNRKELIKALPLVIESLKMRGFKFLKVSELIKVSH